MPHRLLEEIATADMAFEAWGESREELFAACADALLRTMVEDPETVKRRQELTIRLEHEELDLLLFSFLQELIFFKDARRLLLHADGVRLEEHDGVFRLTASAEGEMIAPHRHSLIVDVKAVTLYRFRVAFEDRLWKAVVVLDV